MHYLINFMQTVGVCLAFHNLKIKWKKCNRKLSSTASLVNSFQQILDLTVVLHDHTVGIFF